MNYKSVTLIVLTLFALCSEAEPDYIEALAQRHVVTYPDARAKIVYYAPLNLKEKLKNTNLVIGKAGPYSACATQSMYSTIKNGNPVIVYCPTGYRLVNDLGEGYAYLIIYGAGLSFDAANDLTIDFITAYHDYLSLAAFSIISRDEKQPYPKLCEPLLFVYLYVKNLNPKNCANQVDKYKEAFDWMYNDESNGAITESIIKKALNIQPGQAFDYSNKIRRDFITDFRIETQAGQWFGQLFHEFFHIMNGDLDNPPKSAEENKEREINADAFAIKMLIFDDPKKSIFRVPAFTLTQIFSAASSNTNDFDQRIKLSAIETIKILKTHKDLIPPEYYNKIIANYESACKNDECPP